MFKIACFPKCSNSRRWVKTRGRRGYNSHFYILIISPWSPLLYMFEIACFPKCSNSQRWVKTRGRRGYNSHFYPRIISPWHPLLLFMLKIAYPARGFITEGKIYICIYLHKANRSYNTWFLFQLSPAGLFEPFLIARKIHITELNGVKLLVFLVSVVPFSTCTVLWSYISFVGL